MFALYIVHVLWLTESHATKLTITVTDLHLYCAIPVPNIWLGSSFKIQYLKYHLAIDTDWYS